MGTTWVQIIEAVQRLDRRRRDGRALDGRDAEQLVTMLLDFQQNVVASNGVTLAPPTGAAPGDRVPSR